MIIQQKCREMRGTARAPSVRHRATCGPISPYSGRDCVKSLRSSYKGVYPQTAARRVYRVTHLGCPTCLFISQNLIIGF